ncbi:MAG: TetR family transcriptional regulator [Alphaproteobacteria bacterium]|nr:TetR family transcriptional regulator [Alphaproteobacteria bacterium]
MARRTKEEAEQTKAAILSSALDLFYEKGFARTTFDEIAKRINLTKGAVYWHFRNKADLLAELMRQKFTEKKQSVPYVAKDNNLNSIRDHFYNVAQSIESDPEFCKFLFFVIFHMEWSETIADRVLNQIADLTDFPWKSLKERLTFVQKSGEIPPETNVEDLTILLSCMWRGCVDSYVSKRYPMSLTSIFMQGFDWLFTGLKVEKK